MDTTKRPTAPPPPPPFPPRGSSSSSHNGRTTTSNNRHSGRDEEEEDATQRRQQLLVESLRTSPPTGSSGSGTGSGSSSSGGGGSNWANASSSSTSTALTPHQLAMQGFALFESRVVTQDSNHLDEDRHQLQLFTPVKAPDIPITWRLKERMKVCIFMRICICGLCMLTFSLSRCLLLVSVLYCLTHIHTHTHITDGQRRPCPLPQHRD